jgi:UPF0755 protein
LSRGRVLIGALSVGLALLVAALIRAAYVGPTGSPGGTVVLSQGRGAPGVAAQLARSGVLQNPRTFVLFARLSGADRELKAGRYAVPESVSIKSLIALLRAGPNVSERVLIPEGSGARAIAQILAARAGVDTAAFLDIVLDAESPARHGVPGPTLEGYLFPETYDIPWGAGAADVVEMLVAEYREVMTPERVARAESLGLDERELVTLASIVEAETGIAEERSRVAAVFHNRLRDGWKLDADPTVRFATGKITDDLTKADLEHASPYNTYVHGGLPPGPICNPGKAALDATLNPSVGCRDYFFVARGDGGHTFSRTIGEHNRARAEARRRIAAAKNGADTSRRVNGGS